jgi:adenylate cyclase
MMWSMPQIHERAVALLPTDLDTAWAIVSDANALNRAAGLSPIALTPQEAGVSRTRAATRLAGMDVTYDEQPFEFVAPHWSQVTRVFHNGPFRLLQCRVDLAPETGGVRVTVDIGLTPATEALADAVRTSAAEIAALLADTLRRLADGWTPPRTSVDEARLAPIAARLRKDPAALHAEALLRWVREADDLDVQRLRPYAWADDLGLPRRAALETCLAATEAGLLELAWELVCPSCRNATTTLPSLSTLEGDAGGCHACEVNFELAMDRSVEAVFHPVEQVRAFERAYFCSGGAARTPHVVSQAIVPAGGVAVLVAPERPGHCRVALRGQGSSDVDVAPGGQDELAWPWPDGTVPVVAPGGRVVVRNLPDEARHAKLERTDGVDDAATAADLSTLAAFRRRYGRETLRPGVTLKVGRVALLFSDLADSTRLYARVGDAAAIKLVQDHFELVEACLRAHGGTIVKTIGDAVMAAFPSEVDATAAALDVLAAFGPFRASDPVRAQTDIKLGVHEGPCYAFTANGLLDYFGQTVNVAARLQGLAASGELVVDAHLAEVVRAQGGTVGVPFPAALKGVEGTPMLVRARWPEADGVSTPTA